MLVPRKTFETERLTLRRVTPDDAPAILGTWAQDPEVTRYLAWRPHRTLEETEAYLEACDAAWREGRAYVWVIREKSTAALVGSIAARAGAHGIDLGYLLARKAWGRGLMAEAVEEVAKWALAQTDVFRVWATCDVENPASARVLEKAGFELEGTLRRWDVHPNLADEPRDALCYSRVKS